MMIGVVSAQPDRLSRVPSDTGDGTPKYPITGIANFCARAAGPLGAAMKEALPSTLILILWIVFWLAGTLAGAVLQAWLIDMGGVSDVASPWLITCGPCLVGF